MKIKNSLKRILTSPIRSRNKASVLRDLVEREQQNSGIVNIHRMDSNNVGDYYCAPHHYFEKLKDSAFDIFDYKRKDKEITQNWVERISNSQLIIGGGGLLNRGSFEKQMKVFELLSQKNKKTVLWGVGHNSKKTSDFGNLSSYNIDIKKFGLVGTRDYQLSENWVPCVSCLHPIFDRSFSTEQEVGIVFHKKTMKNDALTSRFQDYPSTSNTTDLKSLIEFIGRSESIITDSYHGMYWSILLGKKVAVIPNSSKFFSFKYQPVITTFENCFQDLKKAEQYSGVLQECREINYKFAEKVFDYLQ